ncbi:MAG: AAA family ATPase [Prochloraceae cyanobacterium]
MSLNANIPDSYQEIVQELDLMLRAKYPLLYLVSAEEDPIEDILYYLADCPESQRDVVMWDIVRGWDDNGTAKGSIMAALDRIRKADKKENILFVLRDIHFILKYPLADRNAPAVREIKNLSKELKRSRNSLIIVSHSLQIPEEFAEEVTVVDFPLPNAKEIDYLITQTVASDRLKIKGLAKEQFIKACCGLSRARILRILAKALAAKQEVNESDLDEVLEEKKQAIRRTGILEFSTSQESLKSVGGLDNLKEWVKMRQNAFTDEARSYGIPNPKGLLLVGIQGTGKSLCAKTIAREWRLPLLRLDAGRLFGGIVGESESRVRQTIKLAEAMSPCVLWMDEIDKAFGNITSGVDGDSGTSRKVFGTLIAWMQEKTAPVFIVATANNVGILPAELLRKGRFDEIFFLNLPTDRERQDIFKVHLQRLRSSRIRDFDLTKLARFANDFSGAEIEQVIIDGMYRGFAQKRDFTTEDILIAIEETVPLAAIASQQIEALKKWAARAGARTASKDLELVDELKKYTFGKDIGSL